jgi:hypothetical protein
MLKIFDDIALWSSLRTSCICRIHIPPGSAHEALFTGDRGGYFLPLLLVQHFHVWPWLCEYLWRHESTCVCVYFHISSTKSGVFKDFIRNSLLWTVKAFSYEPAAMQLLLNSRDYTLVSNQFLVNPIVLAESLVFWQSPFTRPDALPQETLAWSPVN